MSALASEVHIWIIPARDAISGDGTPLTADEWQRAERFHNARHGRHWASFRGALRSVLAQYSNCDPLSLILNTGRYGKPWLAQDTALQFNLSHTANLALLAVTRVCPVGVDVELPRSLSDRDQLVKRNFSQAEQSAFNALPDGEREAAFYAIWTRKEAVLKASGMGLHMPLHAFDVPHQSLPGWVTTHLDDATISHRDYRLKDLSALLSEEKIPADASAPRSYTAAIALTALNEEKTVSPELVCFNYHSD